MSYTGNGTNRTISHNLGVEPGLILIKKVNASADWQVYHRSLSNTEYMVLNATSAKATGTTRWNSTSPTTTNFSLGTDTTVNNSGDTYVAYVFAHDTSTNGFMQCGSASGVSGSQVAVNLGWEPQFLLLRSSSLADQWWLSDSMRGMFADGAGTKALLPNSSNAEYTYGGAAIKPNASGFSFDAGQFSGTSTYIYCAIRRPMKTPTDGTKVFGADYGDSSDLGIKTNTVTDFGILGQLSGADKFYFGSRLTGQNYLRSNTTDAESSHANQKWDRMDGFWNNNLTDYFGW